MDELPKAGSLAFFPWVSVKKPVDVDQFRLEPWNRSSPIPPWTARLLEPYVTERHAPVSRATIVSKDEQVGDEWDFDTINKFFEARDLVSFSALARRRFFSGSQYVCDHSFSAVIQRFDGSQRGGTTRHTRRRDGERVVRATEEVYRVVVPEHIEANVALELDAELLAALARAAADRKTGAWVRSAIAFFNLANTDSSAIREHTEVVQLVASMQALPRLSGHRGDVMTPAVVAALNEVAPSTRTVGDLSRIRDTGSPRIGATLREVWIQDLLRTRNAFSHGRTTTSRRMR